MLSSPDTLTHVDMHRVQEFLDFVADLRDLTARGESIRWSCDAEPKILARLHHLVPPLYLASGVQPTDWRARHRPGQFYFRRGPGFVIVYDGRSGDETETVIDDPEQLALFDRLHRPGAVPPCPATAALRALGVLFELGGKGITLPYRLARLTLPTELL
ncbi:hypothetical protein DFR70_1011028 [Nocardia tenerifensis]|uniref:Uncharacterized protein n=1 Tax=Nocardia tenerifensis TaxID=228006 RepID=A0A318L0E3_9NOCA|nr:DUF5825 family protein [Nocardia tenerifensis]PXX71594.1 hypothetical protein DFR70_1011028 [Nocardia tenerifensis]